MILTNPGLSDKNARRKGYGFLFSGFSYIEKLPYETVPFGIAPVFYLFFLKNSDKISEHSFSSMPKNKSGLWFTEKELRSSSPP